MFSFKMAAALALSAFIGFSLPAFAQQKMPEKLAAPLIKAQKPTVAQAEELANSLISDGRMPIVLGNISVMRNSIIHGRNVSDGLFSTAYKEAEKEGIITISHITPLLSEKAYESLSDKEKRVNMIKEVATISKGPNNIYPARRLGAITYILIPEGTFKTTTVKSLYIGFDKSSHEILFIDGVGKLAYSPFYARVTDRSTQAELTEYQMIFVWMGSYWKIAVSRFHPAKFPAIHPIHVHELPLSHLTNLLK